MSSSSRSVPRYKKLRSALEAQIRGGEYAPGQQLPSTAALVKMHGVSDGTVKRAMRELIQEGLVFALNGKGTFASASLPSPAIRREDAVALVYDSRQGEFIGNIYRAPVLQGIEEELTRQGLRLELVNAILLPVVELVRARRQGAFRAAIVATRISAEEMTDLAGAGAATVSLFFEYPATDGLCCLVPDDLAAVRSAASHLLDSGSRRLGALLTDEDHGFGASRLRAFQTVCKELYGAGDDSYVVHERDSCDGGRRALETLLHRHPEVDAVLTANSLMALGAIDAAKELGRSVPQDLRLIGYDDLGYAHRVSRALSVLRSDGRQMGRRAVQILLESLQEPATGFTVERIQPQLVISDSSSPARLAISV